MFKRFTNRARRIFTRKKAPMFERFTDRIRKVMELANGEAHRFKHEYIGTEHILLGLIKEGSGVGAAALKALDVDLDKARQGVERFVRPGSASLPFGRLPLTPRATAAVEQAIKEAKGLSHNYVGTEHMLLAILHERDGVAAQVLRDLGVNLDDARRQVLIVLGSDGATVEKLCPPKRSASCPLCQSLDRGAENPSCIAELFETTVHLGDNQGCRGWCVLVLKSHHEHLAALPLSRQMSIFEDVSRVAAAIRSVFPASGKDGAPPRINYECLGNLVPHIHWHIIPRHADDPDPTKAVWTWPDSQLKGAMTQEERTDLITKLRAVLQPRSGDIP